MQKLLVVDFGGQYAHLIARRIRELGVYSEIISPSAPLSSFKKAKGIILSGGPHSVYEKNAPCVNKRIFSLGLPILGLCYGHQLMSYLLGGTVSGGKIKEYGKASLVTNKNNRLFKNLAKKEIVWMSHGDEVIGLPEGFESIGSSGDCKNAAIANFEKKLFGFQFHPEVVHSLHGKEMLANFVYKICGAKPTWTMKNYIKQKVKEIKKQVGNKKVLLLVSGGVDSNVAFALLNKSLPKNQIFAIHIDTGFMRKNETELVEKSLRALNFSELIVINAQRKFYSALRNIVNPERKREIIGKVFIDIKDEELAKLGLNKSNWMLGQGTIYPDTIESAGTEHASKIKTHHNRVEQIIELLQKGKLVEPLSELYKDEVRALGKELGLPSELIWRQPFPGPGLAVRMLCSHGNSLKTEKTNSKVKSLISGSGFRSTILPIKSVGVQGDSRTYKKAAVLQGNLNWRNLEKLSTNITNSVREVNRCVYSVFPRRINKMKALKADLNLQRVKVLQEADAIVDNIISKYKLNKKIWQFPVILLPIQVNGNKGETIVLRPVESTEAMTANFFELPKKVLDEIVKKLVGIGISSVLYDITHKPPGTIEWE